MKTVAGKFNVRYSSRLGSGASPGLIAGTADFPPGEEVLHDLNCKLEVLVTGILVGCRGDFKISVAHKNIFFVVFVRCAFVCVFDIYLSLVLGGCWCS